MLGARLLALSLCWWSPSPIVPGRGFQEDVVGEGGSSGRGVGGVGVRGGSGMGRLELDIVLVDQEIKRNVGLPLELEMACIYMESPLNTTLTIRVVERCKVRYRTFVCLYNLHTQGKWSWSLVERTRNNRFGSRTVDA